MTNPLSWGLLRGIFGGGRPVAGISLLILGVLVAADFNLSQKAFTAIVVVVGLVRVAGSWVAAMGILMFGWLMRGQG